MEIHDYVRVLRRNAVLLVSAALIGLAGGTFVALNAPARYDATTTLFVSVQSPSGSSTDLNLGRTYAQQAVSSYVALVPSALVLQPVIDDLGVDLRPAQLAEKVRASAELNSLAISVTVSDGNPSQSARLANAIGESFATVVVEQLEKRDDDSASPIRIDTLQVAQVPVAPVAPSFTTSLMIGGIVGTAAGFALTALRAVLDTRVRSIDDVERATSVPVLGGLAFDPKAPRRPLVVAADSRNPRTEGFRALRTNIEYLAAGGETPVFVITSAGPGEGKSTTAANLAIAFAQSGSRVALVDGDLRMPRVADYFAIEGGVGLTDVLAGRLPASEALQRWGHGALFLLPAGTIPPNPAELLGSAAMSSLLADLRVAFDIVIIDAPPVLLVTDAAVLAGRANGALLVVAAGKTTTPRLRAAIDSIRKVGATVLGTVVTMLPTANPARSGASRKRRTQFLR